MAKSRAQQAAIAISMKKAGKTPKLKLGGTGNVEPKYTKTNVFGKEKEISKKRYDKLSKKYAGSPIFNDPYKQSLTLKKDGTDVLVTSKNNKSKKSVTSVEEGMYCHSKNKNCKESRKDWKTEPHYGKEVTEPESKTKKVGVKKLTPGRNKFKTGGSTPAWTRKEGKNPTGGLNAKGVASYRAANPGSKLQTAVTTKPSKLKAGSKDAKRRKSFCARMSGMPGPMKDEKGRPTRKALSLRKWNC